MLALTEHVCSLVSSLQPKVETVLQAREVIAILEAEERDLNSRKKQLLDEDREVLERNRAIVRDTSDSIPKSCNTLSKLDELLTRAITWLTKSLLEEAGRRNKLSNDPAGLVAPSSLGLLATKSMIASTPAPLKRGSTTSAAPNAKLARSNTVVMAIDIPPEENDFQQTLDRAIELCLERVHDPTSVLALMEIFSSSRAFDAALRLGERAQQLLHQLKAEQALMLQVKSRLADATRKRDELEQKYRRQLEREAQLELRELQLQLALHEAKPKFHALDVNYDDRHLALAKQWLAVALSAVAHWSTTASAAPPSLQPHQQQQQQQRQQQYHLEASANKSKMQEAAEIIVRACLNHISKIPNLIALAQHLEQRREFGMVIEVGLHCEHLINEVHDEYLRRQELEDRYRHLESRYLEQPELEPEYNAVAFEREHLIPMPASQDELRQYTLSITSLMTRAASVEGRDDVMRDQTILAFKADTTQERWDQVRNATTEQEWSVIKQELVGYILKRDDNPIEKIELLMKDGLWKEAIAIFPAPTGKDPNELDLLRRLWIGTEKHHPAELKTLVQTVGRYLKRYFQEYRFEEVYPLLDKVQRRFGDFLKTSYLQATELLCLTIMPSQYPLLIAAFKDLKRRLCDELNRPEEWEDFFTSFKREHKGKKRLVQMATLMGDSTWDITALIKQEEDRELKQAQASKKRERSPKVAAIKKKQSDSMAINDNEDDDDEDDQPRSRPRKL